MRFGTNFLGQVEPPKSAKRAREMFALVEDIWGERFKLDPDWRTMDDESVVKAAALVWAKISNLPVIDAPGASA